MSTGRPVPMVVSMSAHLRPETEIVTHTDAVKDRGWLSVDGPGGAYVSLFAGRAELVRLRDALTAVLAELDAERAALAHSLRADESAA